MKVKINIECEDAGELTSHLYTIIRQIKKICKRDHTFDFPEKTSFEDNNCYGTHNVFIKPEPTHQQLKHKV